MPFVRPTLTALIDRMQSDVEAQLSDLGTLLRRSVVRVLVKVLAAAIHATYGFLNYIADQLFASTADGTYLEIIAGEYGMARTAAEYATGEATVTATVVTTIPAGTKLQNGEGQEYTVDDDTATIVGSNTIAFTAVTAGSAANDDAGITLTFVSAVTGVATTATVDSDGIGGGADEETDDDLRDRILFRKKRPPHGGASHDYVNWAKEYAGVTRAWVYPQYAGNGTLALAFVRDNDATILPNAAQRTAVNTYIQEHVNPRTGETVGIPVTANAGFEIVELTDYPITITVQVYPNTADVQTAITTELNGLLLTAGGPAETIYLSSIYKAVAGAAGVEYFNISAPTSDTTPSFTQMPSFTITFQDYS